MDGMLSQEEINALLNGMDSSSNSNGENTTMEATSLSDAEKDAIGEISNICMGTASTTLFSLLGQKVTITTPTVTLSEWNTLTEVYDRPCIFVQIFYKEGLDGNNILILKEKDAKIITDLMMGGDGTNLEGEFSELHLSAISEAMNQMIGSTATSLSSMLNKKIDINPPISKLIDLNDSIDLNDIAKFLSQKFIKVSFKMEIGTLIDSEIMQLYPIEFAKELYDYFIQAKEASKNENEDKIESQTSTDSQKIQNAKLQSEASNPTMFNQNTNRLNQNYEQRHRDVNVQPAQFQNFDMTEVIQQRESIDLIMDVPLEVTVELGKTYKSIKEILEFAPGTILELDKIAGEPVDVVVNGKMVAKGEVVVIDENFGIRITDIIKK